MHFDEILAHFLFCLLKLFLIQLRLQKIMLGSLDFQILSNLHCFNAYCNFDNKTFLIEIKYGKRKLKQFFYKILSMQNYNYI